MSNAIRKKTTAKLIPTAVQYAWFGVIPVFRASHNTAGDLRRESGSPAFSSRGAFLPFSCGETDAGSCAGACAEGAAVGCELSCACTKEGKQIAANSSRVKSSVKIDLGRRETTTFLPR